MAALWINFFIFIVLNDTIILPFDYIPMIYSLIFINTNILIVIEWPRRTFDDNNFGGFKGQLKYFK
jgi:hypothetical protein